MTVLQWTRVLGVRSWVTGVTGVRGDLVRNWATTSRLVDWKPELELGLTDIWELQW